MTGRNLFESLNFSTINNSSSVIDLTDDLDESDDEEPLTYPDSFSSYVGQILNEKSIASVLSNVEIFYKSQLEYLTTRYDEKPRTDFIDLESDDDEEINEPFPVIDENKEAATNLKSSVKQTYSSYYFLKQSFNCPMVLIDHLIDSLVNINIKDDDCEPMEYPQQIEIDSGIDSQKSGIVTKKDLRLMTLLEAPKIKKSRTNVGRPKRCVSNKMKLEDATKTKSEIVDLIDSDDDMGEVSLSDNSDLYET